MILTAYFTMLLTTVFTWPIELVLHLVIVSLYVV